MMRSLKQDGEYILKRIVEENPDPRAFDFDLREIANSIDLPLTNSELPAVLNHLVSKDWVTQHGGHNEEGLSRVWLCDPGLIEGIEIIKRNQPKTLFEKARIFLDNWVGLIALLTLIVTIVACYFGYKSLVAI